jgi:uncharacterized protein (DUF1778 family)
MTKTCRININLTEDAFLALQTMAAQKGVSTTEFVRNAIALEKWLFELQSTRGRLLVEQDERMFEVVRT